MRALAPFFALSLLAACGTPQERCISGATRDLRVVDRLIAETQGNLARGYALEEVVITRTVWRPCSPAVVVVQPDGSRTVQRDGRMCLDDVEDTVQRPRAIDPAAEQRTLQGLQVQRRERLARAEPAIAACRTLHPE